MLKWTVCQKQQNLTSSNFGSSAIQSVSSGPCYPICRTNVKIHGTSKSRARRVSIRQLNKENRQCHKSIEQKVICTEASMGAESPRLRNSMNMRLEGLPVALRDVSNHFSPRLDHASLSDSIDRVQKRRSCSKRQKKSPCSVSSHKRLQRRESEPPYFIHEDEDENGTKDRGKNETKSVSVMSPNNSPKKKQPCLDVHHCIKLEASPTTAACSTSAVGQPQTAKERIVGSKSPDLNSALVTPPPTICPPDRLRSPSPILPASTPTHYDNPVHFALEHSPPAEPDLLLHKELPIARTYSRSKIPRHLFQDLQEVQLEAQSAAKDILNTSSDLLERKFRKRQKNVKNKGMPCDVSPLARKLAWLRLNTQLTKNRVPPQEPAFEPPTAIDSMEPEEDATAVTARHLPDVILRNRQCLNPFSSNLCDVGEQLDNLEDINNPNLTNNNRVSKRRGACFNDLSFLLNAPLFGNEDIPPTLKRQRVIIRRRPRNSNSGCKEEMESLSKIPRRRGLSSSVLTLPNGIPSPFTQFNVSLTAGGNGSTLGFNCTPAKRPDFILLDDLVPIPGDVGVNNNNKKRSNNNDVTEIESIEGIEPLSNTQTATLSLPCSSITPITVATEESIMDETIALTRKMNQWKRKLNKKKLNFEDTDRDLDVSSGSSCSESTWDSHAMRLKTPRLAAHFSPNSSFEQGSSIASLKTDETDIKMSSDAELELSLSVQSNIVFAYIKRGKNLTKAIGCTPLNAYVKVNLVPAASEKTYYRTCVRKNSMNPRFDQKFSMEITEADHSKRILFSVWHRDRAKGRSEFLGCVSFALKNAAEKEISGNFRLLGPGANKIQHVLSTPTSQNSVAGMMADQLDSSGEETLSAEENPTPIHDPEDSLFLRHLELDPPGSKLESRRGGRTPFTTTRKLTKAPGQSFGFSIAWTHPPRACGNQLSIEVYRRIVPSGMINRGSTPGPPVPVPEKTSILPPRSVSSPGAVGLPFDGDRQSKSRLQHPQITFTTEGRESAANLLLNIEQEYALCLQFGISRFLLPLAERRDLVNQQQHQILFQNSQELLRLTEDVIEHLVQEKEDAFGKNVGLVYLNKINSLCSAYRKYCIGIKKADCLLVEKTRNREFMKLLAEPPIPRKRPDLTTFLHKPLEHFREVIKQLKMIQKYTDLKDPDHQSISKVVQQFQISYREMTLKSGLMEPEGDGRPLLSLQDLESRLVFTRCKPFVVSTPGREWIFGGDLSRVEGKTVRTSWAILFSDLLVFAKVSRDRVLFITEEPLQLKTVKQALFNIRKKATEFRLLINMNKNLNSDGSDSPESQVTGCGLPDFTHTPQKNDKTRSVILRAPTLELKAVWQNLIQRQIIYLNTTARGGTPAGSPVDSPNSPSEQTTWNRITMLMTLNLPTHGSTTTRIPNLTPNGKRSNLKEGSVRERVLQLQVAIPIINKPNRGKMMEDLIENRCRQLCRRKSSVRKGSALHLSDWLKGRLGAGGNMNDEPPSPEEEMEIWSRETLHARMKKLRAPNLTEILPRNESRMEDLEFSEYSRSASRCTINSQVIPESKSPDGSVTVCRKCHNTCLVSPCSTTEVFLHTESASRDFNANPIFDEPSNNYELLSPSDPFNPLPGISVHPPSPPKKSQSQETEDDSDEGEDLPYQVLPSTFLKRYDTMSSLEKLDREQDSDEPAKTSDAPGQLESMSTYLGGWTAKAGSYVAEKMSFFEKLGQDSFLDKYLNRATQELPATSTCLAFDDEMDTASGASGEELWGTPTSGPDSEITSPPPESPSSGKDEYADADRTMPASGSPGLSTVRSETLSRFFATRMRLEPLPEDEEVISTSTNSSSPDTSACTQSCPAPQSNHDSRLGAFTNSYGFFHRLKLRRTQSADSHSTKQNKLMLFLKSRRSEDGRGRLSKLFGQESSSDNILTTMPQSLNVKNSDRRFWKQFRRKKQTNS
ncbi:uncharacterized protein PsGEF isoform X4 [Bemisia tabaci]|uniref:uncharacterized protein PsGEF isoform X4 n=1 Tax=Bemisia tabaci TaxID=7038 RepID=UPI003B286D57